MSNTYIKFSAVHSGNKKTPEDVGGKISREEGAEPSPVSNPDFEDKFEKVAVWLIEFEADSYFPNREIGLDNLNNPIVIMPWGRNYGYWTDNNLVIADFRKNFTANNITKSEFDKYWNLFEMKN